MNLGDLERALRRCLADQGRRLPVADRDLADAAVRRALRTRQRRAGATLLTLVVIAVVAWGGFVQVVQPSPQPHGVPAGLAAERPDEASIEAHRYGWSPPASRGGTPTGDGFRRERVGGLSLPVDLVVGRHLITRAGDTVDLSLISNVVRTYRTSDGWLALGSERKSLFSLWLVSPGGTVHRLLTGATAVVVSSDARQVAWRAGPELLVGAVEAGSAGRLEPAARLSGAYEVNHAAPVGFVGQGVLLSRVVNNHPEYGVWWPQRVGNMPIFRPAATVYGPLNDGRTVVGQLTGADPVQTCLTLFDVMSGFTAGGRRCDLPLDPVAPGSVSPGGRWLLTSSVDGQAVLLDLQSLTGGETTVYDVGSAGEGPIVWVNEQTALRTVDGRRIIRMDTGLVTELRGGTEFVRLPSDLPSGTIQLVVPLPPAV